MTARKSRPQQRLDTERRILTAARRLFAESGYDRTTIRAIATAANTDPGLVMRYFGSKDALFARVAELDTEPPLTGDPPQVAERLLASLSDKLRTEPAGTMAMLRSMLTHPDAAKEVHAALTAQQHQVAEAMPGEDAMLRAGLIGAVTLGAIIGRDLLRLEGLRDADPERVIGLLRPAIHALTHGSPETAPRTTS